MLEWICGSLASICGHRVTFQLIGKILSREVGHTLYSSAIQSVVLGSAAAEPSGGSLALQTLGPAPDLRHPILNFNMIPQGLCTHTGVRETQTEGT